MRISTLVRLAISGTKTDLVRVVVTVLGSAAAVFAWLCAATVASIGARGGRYSTALIREPGLRPGVIATFVLLTIPVLALVAQCARLGAPARDRRIAAMRLAGATPSQSVAIGAGESGVSAALGALIGLGVYLTLRQVVDSPVRDGQRPLPTDVLPPAWAIAVICVALPLLVAPLSARMLRRVLTSPLGVVHEVRRRRSPGPWAGILIIGGIGIFAGFGRLARVLADHDMTISGSVSLILFYLGVLSTAIGVAIGAGWVAHQIGRLLRRFGQSPASQIAASRLIADPWQGSRTFGVLMVAAIFGGGTAGVWANFATTFGVRDDINRLDAAAQHQDLYLDDHSFYTNALTLVGIAIGIAVVVAAFGQLVAVTEAIVSRRRTYAALVATGVPRSVLARATIWQSLAVAVPSLLIATTAGLEIARMLLGTSITDGGGETGPVDGPMVSLPTITRAVPVPWAQLALVAGGSIVAVALTVGVGLLFLKASTTVEELRTA